MARKRMSEYFQVITGMLLKYGKLNRYELANILRISPTYAREVMLMYYHSSDVRSELERLGFILVMADGFLRISGESLSHSLSDYQGDG